MSIPAVIIKPSNVHYTTLIFLHGLGDTGHGWASMLKSIVPAHCKLVCPHAPTLPLTVYDGHRMPAWFDVLARGPTSAEQDPASVAKARADLEQLIAEETSPPNPGPGRCLLGGFSQGGALALYTGLTTDRFKLAGLIGLSCYLPLAKSLGDDPPQLTRPQPPVFMAHGDADNVVRPEMGEAARIMMQQKLGVTDLRFRGYPGLDHSAGEQELEDLKEFILAMLPEKPN